MRIVASGAMPSSIWMSRSPSPPAEPAPAPPPPHGIVERFVPAPPAGVGSAKCEMYSSQLLARNPSKFDTPIFRPSPRIPLVKIGAVSYTPRAIVGVSSVERGSGRV